MFIYARACRNYSRVCLDLRGRADSAHGYDILCAQYFNSLALCVYVLAMFCPVFNAIPDSQLLNLLSVSRLVAVLNEPDQCGVFCQLQKLDGGVFRCAVQSVLSSVYKLKSSGERTQP